MIFVNWHFKFYCNYTCPLCMYTAQMKMRMHTYRYKCTHVPYTTWSLILVSDSDHYGWIRFYIHALKPMYVYSHMHRWKCACTPMGIIAHMYRTWLLILISDSDHYGWIKFYIHALKPHESSSESAHWHNNSTKALYHTHFHGQLYTT